MKKLYFIASMFIATVAMAQIPNGNFEHWDSTIALTPMGYQTSNFGGNLPPGAPPNVTRVTGYHASYGAQLTTILFGKDTGFAFLTNSPNNPVKGQGGIPYSQQATGMRLYYKCNVIAGDSAGVMFVFKKAGSIIGTYYYTFTGTTASYTLLAKTFSPALTMKPDSVIFAATSSNAIFGGTGKPGSTLTIDSVTFTGVSSQPAMMNGDFENWMPDSAYMPQAWLVTTVGMPRSTDRISGKYSLQLVTGANPHSGGQIQQGYAIDGIDIKITPNHDSIIGGYPYAHSSDSIIFYYKYAAGFAGDSAWINMQFNKNSKVLNWYGFLVPPSATWKRVSRYFNIGSTPDSVLVSFSSSKIYNPSTGGSVLKVDSVQFYSQILAGIEPISVGGDIKVYPNPAKDVLNIDMSSYNGKLEKVNVYDMSGKLVVTQNYTFGGVKNTVVAVDMANLSSGVYIIRLLTDKGEEFRKISKL